MSDELELVAWRRGRNFTRWPQLLTASERFWLKVYVRGDCWEWRGHINRKGYGRFNIRGEPVSAHRFAYEEAKGTIPIGLQVDHICRHRWCVKPSHLEVVTGAVNTRRGDSRNRKKTVCPKCGGPFRTTRIQSGVCGGRVMRFCPPCKSAYFKAWRERGRGR